VLFWGVLGAIVLRALFILIGAALLQNFHWIIFIFGGFLVYTGLRIVLQKHEEVHPERSPLVRMVRRFMPTVADYHGARFFVTLNGRRHATPLFLVLLAVEATDVVFAVDSIPAIFAITPDPFIVFTSNIFAILGLRALYFLLAGVIDKFRYLKVGLGLVLAFVGVKMLISDWFKIPVQVSLGVVCGILGTAILASLVSPPAEPPLPEPERGAMSEPLPHDETVPPARG
jgi:tellurite resistance protein TerC